MRTKFKFKPDKADCPGARTNGQSAGDAETAAKAASLARGETPKAIGEDQIIDLLADTLHLCDRLHLDGIKLFSVAKRDWRSER